MTSDPAPDETARAWLIARAWAHLDYREMIAIRGIAPDLARMLEGLCSMYAIRIGGEGQTTYTRIRGAEERPMSPRDAADDRSRDGQDMRLDERKIGDEGCTCTLPPSYEGPCAWCDIHGQPSVAFEQGVAEGENSGRIFERELRDLRTKFAALRAELAETRTAMDAFHRSATAMRRDRDRLSEGLRVMARRKVRDRHRAAIELEDALGHIADRDTQIGHMHEEIHRLREQRDGHSARVRDLLAELKAGRVAGVTRIAQLETTLADATEALTKAPLRPTTYHWETYAVDRKALIRRFWAVLANEAVPSDSTPADLGPLTPHPPPWPVDEP